MNIAAWTLLNYGIEPIADEIYPIIFGGEGDTAELVWDDDTTELVWDDGTTALIWDT